MYEASEPGRQAWSPPFASEIEMEDWFFAQSQTDPNVLWVDRQVYTPVGVIDILVCDTSGCVSTVELKNGPITVNAIAQAGKYRYAIDGILNHLSALVGMDLSQPTRANYYPAFAIGHSIGTLALRTALCHNVCPMVFDDTGGLYTPFDELHHHDFARIAATSEMQRLARIIASCISAQNAAVQDG